MPWAKLRSQSKYNLATSGVAHWKLRDLPIKIEDLEISGPSFYGYEPLQNALALHCGVSANRVVARPPERPWRIIWRWPRSSSPATMC